MNLFNINNPSEKVSLKQALFKSVVRASDLYMPERIPLMPPDFFKNPGSKGLKEIALEVSTNMFMGAVPGDVLYDITDKAFTFDIPLKRLDDDVFVLELFHGPTLAFKDIGARFMAGLLEYFLESDSREIIILVATSGDTGSAVANAFYKKKGIRVCILYPSGRVSDIQEKQLTTMGGNVIALEVDGDFDACQRMVKTAFADEDLGNHLNLTSANSINFGRLFPQSFYYFHAIGSLPSRKKPVVFSVPSGNFGNLAAGLLAGKMGLQADRFIASTNINHSVPDYLKLGVYEPKPTRSTITNAMDVGNPSNFPRILSLFGNDHTEITRNLKGYWFTDDETRGAMKTLYDRFGYQADPHGAVGFLGLIEYMKKTDCTGIFLETAHPVKFKDEVENATGNSVDIPADLQKLIKLKKESIKIPAYFEELKKVLLNIS